MAIDTATKRFSMLARGMPFASVVFVSDGTIDPDDRFALMRLYAGLVEATSYSPPTWTGAPADQVLDRDQLMTPIDLRAYTTVYNGAGPGAFTVASGELPAGLQLSSNGVLSGTPIAAVLVDVTFRVTDQEAATAVSDVVRFTVNAPPSSGTANIYGSLARFGFDLGF